MQSPKGRERRGRGGGKEHFAREAINGDSNLRLLIELLTRVQVVKDSVCLIECVLRYFVQCSGVNTLQSFVFAFVFSRKSLEPY